MEEKRVRVKHILRKSTPTCLLTTLEISEFFSCSATPLSRVNSNEEEKKGQLKIGNQYFEQVCKNDSWVPDEMKCRLTILEEKPPLANASSPTN